MTRRRRVAGHRASEPRAVARPRPTSAPRPSPRPRVVVETEASGGAVTAAGASGGAGATRAVGGLRAVAGRRVTVMAVLTAVVVLAAGVAVFSALRVGALHGGNSAVADTVATAQVTDQVGSDVKAIFSYDYDNLARTERAASSVLVDEAVGQYQAGYAAAKQQVTDQKLVRTTTISSIAVQDLRADTAHLLVFLDQQTLTTTSNQQSSASAALSVTARKVDGTWKIASMTAL